MSGGSIPPIKPSLSELSSIQYSYQIKSDTNSPPLTALVVRFEGKCGYGYDCNNDATFMCAVIAAGLEAWLPSVLILDLSALSYSWGDQMVRPFDMHHVQKPGLPPVSLTVAVVSELNIAGLTSLVCDEMFSDPKEFLFESLETAFAAVQKRAQAVYDSQPPAEDQILNLIELLKRGEGTIEEANRRLEQLQWAIPCPDIWELMVFSPPDATPESILTQARQPGSK